MPKYLSGFVVQLVVHIRIAAFLILDVQLSPKVSPDPLWSSSLAVSNMIESSITSDS